MPSKCLLKKLEESIEDIKIIYEFYCENGGDSIMEMIPPVKYLLACIADIFNDGVNSSKGFYSVFESTKPIEGELDANWDEFDKGLIWIIQNLNKNSLSSLLNNTTRLLKNYNGNSLMITRRPEILNLLGGLERSVKFQLYQDDLYLTKVRFKPKLKEIDDKSLENESLVNTKEDSPIMDPSLNASFISMEAIDVKLLQEREMRNDFGFMNKLKYNSIRFINNFRVSQLKTITSDFKAESVGDFESINIFASSETVINEFEGMEICPERGLIAQNYSCSQCGNGISAKDSIKCDFSGNYMCPKCHGGKEGINPIRILRNWDFKRYPISDKSRKVIANASYNNLINFPKLNPKEFKSNEKFEKVKILREKIFKSTQKRLKAVGKSEQKKQLALLEKLAWPKTHLLSSVDLYTIEDLIEIERETFYPQVLLPLYNLLKL